MTPAGSASTHAEVGAFYREWRNFVTLKTFANHDKYNPKDAPDRHNRRRMEAENKKRRTKARKEYIDTVQNLVYFIKKRDPRVKAMEKHAAEQKEADLRLAAERKAEQAAEYKRAREQQKQQLSSDDEVDELMLSDDEQLTTFSCSVVIVFDGAEQTHSATGNNEKAARLAAASKALASLSSAKQFQSKKGQAALRGNAVAALNKLWQKSILADKPEYMCSAAESPDVATTEANAVDSDEDDHDQDQGPEDREDGAVPDRSGNGNADDDVVGEDAIEVQQLRENEIEQQMLGMTQNERKKFKEDMEEQNRRRHAWSEPEQEPEPVSESDVHENGSDVGADGQGTVEDEEFSAAIDKRRARVDCLQSAKDAGTSMASRVDEESTAAQEDQDAVPTCSCASCTLGGKCITEMTEKEKKKFEKVQAAAEKARLWREEHGQEEGGGEQDEEPVVPTKKDKKKKKLAKVEKKSERKRAGRMKT